VFQNREEAGWLLAKRLAAYCDDQSSLILALPRGGVAVGYSLSLALRLPLDVFITRKLGAPGNPEYAIGAVTETGSVFLNPEAGAVLQAIPSATEYLEKAIQAQQDEIARRQVLYRQARPLPALTERTVLLVDDGIATGATFLASAKALRELGVQRLVAAIPVGPQSTLSLVRRQVDEMVVLATPEPFFAVGNHYIDFAQVEDAGVIRYLAAAASAFRGNNQPSYT
jgi:putative phosphoribosyl transferase